MLPKSPSHYQDAAKKDAIKVFGNFFVPEMRTVCALLDLNEIPYSCDTIDIFSEQGQKEYLGFNPSEQMPTIIEGYQTIIGDPPHLYKYLCKTKAIDEKFYPTKDMNQDRRKIIDQFLEFIQWMLKRCTQRLTKLKFQKLLLSKGLLDIEEAMYSEIEEQKEEEILMTLIFPNLETSLDGGKPYLCGYDFSVADIAYFNEITNVLAMLEINVDPKKFPNTDKWMKRISDLGAIRVSTIKFQEEFKRLQSIMIRL